MKRLNMNSKDEDPEKVALEKEIQILLNIWKEIIHKANSSYTECLKQAYPLYAELIDEYLSS